MGQKETKNWEQGEELIQPAFCMYLNIQCNKRGTSKNQFTYETLCRCRQKPTGKLQIKKEEDQGMS